MKYVRVLHDIVQEVFVPPSGIQIEECFHPDVVAQFEQVSDDVNVDVGFIKHQDGSFTPPAPPSIPVTDIGATA